VKSVAVVLLAGSVLAGASGVRARHAARQQPPATASAEKRAVAYLAREVPAWRREHPCYSCHNNGDAARALIAALGRKHDVRTALDDTLAWLAEPRRWETNGGGEGGSDDKRLARIQFAHAAMTAAAASLVPNDVIGAAATIVAADQQADGSWRLDSSDSIGSPATYGTALATAFARRTLVASGLPSLKAATVRADQWLRGIATYNVPDAAAIVFAFADGTTTPVPANWNSALELLRKGQGRDGAWGPYVTSPAEPFDTALAMLALQELTRRRARVEPVYTTATLRGAIARGRRYLIGQQLADGSWTETTRLAGQSSYAQRISTTGWALLALLETTPTVQGSGLEP